MPANKNAVIRYKILDELLSKRQLHYNTKALQDECNKALMNLGYDPVVERVIEKDLAFIQGEPFNVEIKRYRVNGKLCKKYKEGSPTIFTRKLSREEETLLKEVLSTIGQFDGLESFEWLDNLKKQLNIEEAQKIISFRVNSNVRDSSLLGQLFSFISDKQVVEITYRKFKSAESTRRVVSPYLLNQYEDRWYLVAKQKGKDRISQFALDRIESVKAMYDESYQKCNEDLSKLYDDVIGITILPEKTLQEVVLWVSNESFDYIETKPLHHSQKIYTGKKLDSLKKQYGINDGHIISISVKENFELYQTILSLGENIAVLSPKEIKEEIKSRLEKMMANYK